MKVGVYVVSRGTEDQRIALALCGKYSFGDFNDEEEFGAVIFIDYHSGTMDELSAKVAAGGDAKVVLIKSDAVASYHRENDNEFHLITLSMQEKINLMNGDARKLLEISFLKSDMELRLPKK